ncbi:MAG: protein kinase [candidate division WOR-3 bacterium]
MFDNDKTIRKNFENNEILQDEKTIVKNYSVSRKENVQENSVRPTKIKDYIIEKEFPAQGGESDTYLVSKNNEKYFLKFYRKGIVPKSEVIKKIMNLSKNNKDFFVQIYEFEYDDVNERYYEVMEYAQAGTLKDFVKKRKLSLNETKEFVKKVNKGLKILHDEGIIYLDLKPSNLLLRNDNIKSVIFSDFGISNLLDDEQTMRFTQVRGTTSYMSPEMLSGAMRKESDYWTLGMTLYELVFGELPFKGATQQVVFVNITTKNIEIPEKIDQNLRILIKGLLLRDYEKRWGFQQVNNWIIGKIEKVVEEDETESITKPFELNGKFYNSLKDLSYGIAENEENWNLAIKNLGRGEFSSVCDFNKQKKDLKFIQSLKDSGINEDLKIMRLIYQYNKSLPFVIFGKKITVNNLKSFLFKYLSRKSTAAENKIIDLMLNGEFISFIDEYIDLTKSSNNEVKVIRNITIFVYSSGLSEKDKITCLRILLERYSEKDQLTSIENRKIISILEKNEIDLKSVKILKKILGFEQSINLKLSDEVENLWDDPKRVGQIISKQRKSRKILNFFKIIPGLFYLFIIIFSSILLYQKSVKDTNFRVNFWGTTTFAGIYDRLNMKQEKEKEIKLLGSIKNEKVKYGYYFITGKKESFDNLTYNMIINEKGDFFDRLNFLILKYEKIQNPLYFLRFNIIQSLIFLIIFFVVVSILKNIIFLPSFVKSIFILLAWLNLLIFLWFLAFTNGIPMLPESYIKLSLFSLFLFILPNTFKDKDN